MTHHAVVPGSAPRDDADTPGAITVDGNALARTIPVDDVTAAVKNPDPRIAPPTSASPANEHRKYLESVLVWSADIGSPQDWTDLHINAKNDKPAKNGGKPCLVCWPFKPIDDLVNRMEAHLDARVAALLQR